jgi:hypothetical protein
MMRYPEPTSDRQEELNRRVEIKILRNLRVNTEGPNFYLNQPNLL